MAEVRCTGCGMQVDDTLDDMREHARMHRDMEHEMALMFPQVARGGSVTFTKVTRGAG